MRSLFVITGVVFFLAAGLIGVLLLGGGGYETLERAILAAGFAVAGGMCYIAAGLQEAGRRARVSAIKREYEEIGA